MASGGYLVFPGNDSADSFVKNNLVKSIKKIELQWNNIRVDSLDTKFAFMGASFHEILTDTAGREIPQDGYFTGLVEHTGEGWQLRNAHWSQIAGH